MESPTAADGVSATDRPSAFRGPKRVCVQWPRFGPYHLARLNAAARYFGERGCELIGLETASRETTYAWREENDGGAFRREQVFPGRVFEQLKPVDMHRAVLQKLDALQPDGVAIHTYSFPDSRACLSWCRKNRRVAVVMSDSREDDGPRVAWREALKRQIVSQYDAGLAAGTPQRAYLEQLGIPAERVFPGYDVVDNAYFARVASEVRADPVTWYGRLDLPTGTRYFLSVNRMLPYKNLDGLLMAYAQYRKVAADPWSLVVVGDGPDLDRLQRIISDHEIGGVILPGFRQIDELPGYYALAGALVHPTFRDTWGLTINEAMACGLPVLVSTRAGCVTDLVIDGQNGYRFDPADGEALTSLLVRVAADHDLRAAMGARSRTLIERWSLDLFSQSLWNAFGAGQSVSHRPLNPLSNLLIQTLARTARRVDSFQALPI